jgi:hypothetical protein
MIFKIFLLFKLQFVFYSFNLNLTSILKSLISFRKKCMFYSFGFLDLDHLPIKKFLLMHTYKFEDENQAMYCPLDIEVTIKSLK